MSLLHFLLLLRLVPRCNRPEEIATPSHGRLRGVSSTWARIGGTQRPEFSACDGLGKGDGVPSAAKALLAGFLVRGLCIPGDHVPGKLDAKRAGGGQLDLALCLHE